LEFFEYIGAGKEGKVGFVHKKLIKRGVVKGCRSDL
jgi:hypothetical protein